MGRSTVEDVHGVIDTEAEASVIEGFIDDANLEVNERVNAANVGYSDERMKKIEKYLAAHLVRFLWDRQETSTGVANVDTSYSGAFGEGLTGTSAGQTVLDSDTADVFSAELNPDEDEAGGGRFITRDRYVTTADRGDRAGDGRVEGSEHEVS